MSGIYDYDEDDGWQHDFESEDEYLAYLDWLGGMDAPWAELSPIVERIRAYTQAEDAVIQMEVAAVEAYIERGINECEAYLAKHAAFEDYLRERES